MIDLLIEYTSGAHHIGRDKFLAVLMIGFANVDEDNCTAMFLEKS